MKNIILAVLAFASVSSFADSINCKNADETYIVKSGFGVSLAGNLYLMNVQLKGITIQQDTALENADVVVVGVGERTNILLDAEDSSGEQVFKQELRIQYAETQDELVTDSFTCTVK